MADAEIIGNLRIVEDATSMEKVLMSEFSGISEADINPVHTVLFNAVAVQNHFDYLSSYPQESATELADQGWEHATFTQTAIVEDPASIKRFEAKYGADEDLVKYVGSSAVLMLGQPLVTFGTNIRTAHTEDLEIEGFVFNDAVGEAQQKAGNIDVPTLIARHAQGQTNFYWTSEKGDQFTRNLREMSFMTDDEFNRHYEGDRRMEPFYSKAAHEGIPAIEKLCEELAQVSSNIAEKQLAVAA